MAWEVVRTLNEGTTNISFDLNRYRYRFRLTNYSARMTLIKKNGGTYVFSLSTTDPDLVVEEGHSYANHLKDTTSIRVDSISGNIARVEVSREIVNHAPSVALETVEDVTLYENDTLNLTGTVQDVDSGNKITVKYSINNGTARTLHTFVSDGSAVSFSKSLTFKRDKLHDGSTAVTGDLQEGVTHTLSVWAEDDQGGKSTAHSRTFNVIPNRPEVKVNGQSRVVETIYCKVNGQAREVVGIWTKVNGELREV